MYLSYYVPISLNYFLNCSFKPSKCPKKSVCTNDGRLKTVRDILEYWRQTAPHDEVESQLRPGNQEYYLSIKYGFRKNVPDTGPGSKLDYKLTPQLFESLEPMNVHELEEYLKNNPIPLEPHRVAHGTHRAFAMIGHLLNGGQYSPLYLDANNLYCNPGCHWPHNHSSDPILNVKYIQILDNIGIPRDEYTLCNSAILSAIGIRENADLDIVITSKLRKEFFNSNPGSLDLVIPGLEKGKISIVAKDSPKYKIFGCQNDDDLIKKYSINLNGYNFCEPRFYFHRMHKNKRTPHRSYEENRKIKEYGKSAVELYNKNKDWQLYPFSKITQEQWGFDLIQEVVDL